jgi:hypothetical protein
MPPKQNYTHEAEKGAFWHDLDNGEDLTTAAKKAKISIETARGIKRHANAISYACVESS